MTPEEIIIEAVAWKGYPYKARAVKARKAHACDMASDVSWGRACRTIQPGETYVRVKVFRFGNPPLRGAICTACAEGCPA